MSFLYVPYPKTLHLPGSKRARDDASMDASRLDVLVGAAVVVEEKLDGTPCEVGFDDDASATVAFNGEAVDVDGEGGPHEALATWVRLRRDDLFDRLGNRFVACAEWCGTKHTVYYDRLLDYFNEFDVFDKEAGTFLDTERRRTLFEGSSIVHVPVLSMSATTVGDLRRLLGRSSYRSDGWRHRLATAAKGCGADPDRTLRETMQSDRAEGLYVKAEANGSVVGRFKFVTAEFLDAVSGSGGHWASRLRVRNGLASGYGSTT